MLNPLPDRFNALVVGANRGIGLGLARELVTGKRVGRIFCACREPGGASDLHALAESDHRVRALPSRRPLPLSRGDGDDAGVHVHAATSRWPASPAVVTIRIRATGRAPALLFTASSEALCATRCA
jgi:NAD(P)-dependent dehydrogenase (short-subunit alcohol dehydrogenase family)